MKYQKTPKTPPRWGLWDILLWQIVLCLLIGLGVWQNVPLLRDSLRELLNQPELTAEDFRPVQEAVETFLNQHIHVEPMGGQLPAEAGEVPENCTTAAAVTAAELTAPLSGRITSDFGFREHPISGESDFHSGIDIAAAEGTAIHAVADGVVEEAGWSDTYGNYLVLSHSPDFSTKYAHCSRLIAQAGDILRKGERIALVGSTGVSTGPHLHVETIVQGLRCDPLWLL